MRGDSLKLEWTPGFATPVRLQNMLCHLSFVADSGLIGQINY